MSVVIWPQEVRSMRTVQANKDGWTYGRAFTGFAGNDWDTLGLGLGDILPTTYGVAYAEVTNYGEQRQKDSPQQPILTLKAFVSRLYPTSGFSEVELRTAVTRELFVTRIQQKNQLITQYVRRFEIYDAALTESTGGWTATGLPVLGEAYPAGSFTIAPVVSDIQIERGFTPTKSLATVTYTAYFTTSD